MSASYRLDIHKYYKLHKILRSLFGEKLFGLLIIYLMSASYRLDIHKYYKLHKILRSLFGEKLFGLLIIYLMSASYRLDIHKYYKLHKILRSLFGEKLFGLLTLPTFESREEHLEFFWVRASQLSQHNLMPSPLIKLVEHFVKGDYTTFWDSTFAALDSLKP